MATFIPRLHLFEFEDLRFFPSRIRNYMTDFLRHSTIRMKLHHPIVEILTRAIEKTERHNIIDLCSGGGGLLAGLEGYICETGPSSVSITFTDKYPNIEALSAICQARPEALSFERASIDATDVPRRLKGIRTMFSSFHHFRPDVAQKILADAVESQQGIAVFEISRRSVLGLVPMLLSPIGTWIITPFIRPFNLRRLFFTYIIPAVPFFVMWDGVVSAFRTYTVEEMEAMVACLEPNNYEWDIAITDAPYNYKITYLIGVPK